MGEHWAPGLRWIWRSPTISGNTTPWGGKVHDTVFSPHMCALLNMRVVSTHDSQGTKSLRRDCRQTPRDLPTLTHRSVLQNAANHAGSAMRVRAHPQVTVCGRYLTHYQSRGGVIPSNTLWPGYGAGRMFLVTRMHLE